MSTGKIKIESEQTFILISEITVKPAKEAPTETHHHLDIQMSISASETIGWIALESYTTATETYNADNDVAFGVEKTYHVF